MDLPSKLRILADAAKYDASCASSGARAKGNGKGLGNKTSMGICHSYAPDGRCISLLKILLTNYCIYDCTYCVNRVSSATPRARFTPAEVVSLTLEFYKRNYIEGLFLSSGIIKSPDDTMALLAEVARSLREEHHFGGYIHLKAVPGASPEALEGAGLFADRLSANVELPTQEDLDALAPAKRMQDVEDTMGAIRARRDEAIDERKRSRKAPRFAPAGQSTQLIVGATPTPDRAILATSDHLYRTHRLRRVYYSAFSPIPSPDPRLPLAAPPLVREHRLYQADWLLRNYGFRLGELFDDDDPGLPMDIDPKLAWALRHRHLFPVDVNRAPKEMLLRIPGIGTRSVGRILRSRRRRRLRWDDLLRIGIVGARAKAFVDAPGVPRAPLIEEESHALRAQLRDDSPQLDLFANVAPARAAVDAPGGAPSAGESALSGQV